MKKTFFLLISLATLLASSGCQTWQKADQDARAVALVTSQRVLTIQQELKVKIAAERAFYKSQLDTIEKSGLRSEENKLIRRLAETALSQADELVKNKGDITPEAIATRLSDGTTEVFDELRTARDHMREQREVSEKSIRELELMENRYESLNKTLVQLTTPPGPRDQMDQVVLFIKTAAENFKRLQQEAKDNSANN